MDERINPIIIRFNDQEPYVLDFNREAVRFAESRGFDPDDVLRYPATKIPEFFFYAFRMHNRKIAKNQTDDILEKLGGLTPKMLERLRLLYDQAIMSDASIIQDDEDLVKNGSVTVEME